ncbi:MAG: ATP-binding protein [Ruminiclostridium sp.]|jgi:predicted AAA+ superfamily ATPase|nr:ATP-binding protein [Ruminiclostridium sp.]
MDQLVSRLLLYGELEEESILRRLAELFQAWKEGEYPRQELIRGLYRQVKRLLDLATDYGFDENLWQNYLTFLLMTNENSFSLITERAGEQMGSVHHFAKEDFAVFRALFHYDFTPLEQDLGIDCFSTLCHYQAIAKHERRYNKNVSEKVRQLSHALAEAPDEEAFFALVTDHYRRYGVGLLGLNKAFRIRSGPRGVELLPIYNTDKVMLRDLVGYESQKQQLRANTEAFLAGRSANNVLLYGDAGTGKSSSVKALINEYYDQGLRMIELYKHQFQDLSAVIAMVKNRNYRFIIFIDDLSFEENEVEYKFLKAVIEGGVETKPDNVLLYATSNRRNLIRETWKDRGDMELQNEVHRSDTLEEKLSLSARFGVRINYSIPNRSQFQEIVLTLAQRQGVGIPQETLLAEANKWELRHGGVSGRTAQQFINHVSGSLEGERHF